MILLSCPFCKSELIIVNKQIYPKFYFTECQDCGATGPEAKTPEDAIKKWNFRYAPDTEGNLSDGSKN